MEPVYPRAEVKPGFEKSGSVNGRNVLRNGIINPAVIRRNRQIRRMSQNNQQSGQDTNNVIDGGMIF